MKYLKTALLVSSVALFTACGGGSSSSSVDYSGNYEVALAAISGTVDKNGNTCLGGNGYINISNSTVSGTIISSWGNAYSIDGDVASNGSIIGNMHVEDYLVGLYEGQMDASGGHGTWEDVLGCTGEWAALKQL